jgi:CheY-like chemotaxis protein
MSRVDEIPPDVSAARMLAEALRAALAPNADAESFAAARAAAQIAGLDGLDACMAALEPHRGAPWPPSIAAIADRVMRITNAGRLQGFRDADRELGAHASEVSGMHWERSATVISSPDGPAQPSTPITTSVATVTVAEALEELPLAGPSAHELAHRTWVTVPVAAALRAALEWMTVDAAQPRPFALRVEDSVLEVLCESIRPGGLHAAHEALSAADGSLAPLSDSKPGSTAGAWLVRVPAWSSRPLHLMIEQGPLRLAVPWHAVMRMSLVPAIELEMRKDSLSTPVLPALAPLAKGIGERPVITVAHGLKRGLLVADRLVWRLAAEVCEPPAASPDPRLVRAVRSEEGDVFWVVEPRELLEPLPLPALPAAEEAKVAPPAPKKAAPPAPKAVESPAPAPAPLVLTEADVTPLRLTAADVTPIEAPAPAAVVAQAPAPILEFPDWLERPSIVPAAERAPRETGFAGSLVVRSSALATRPVLIAEDSLAARHFLARLFEREGFEPQVVASAGELCRALSTRRWSMVAVDVELPDARGVEWLTEVRTELERADVPCVALVRDDPDAELARAAGIRRWLRKPFDREELIHLLRRTRLIPGETA